MLQYLCDTLGIQASLNSFNDKNRLPFYLTDIYHFSVLKILEQEFIYLEVIDKLPFKSDIKKHMNIIYQKCDMPCILGVRKITSYQRKGLIDEKISFVLPYQQLFVPCLGISLTEEINKKVVLKSSEFLFLQHKCYFCIYCMTKTQRLQIQQK